MNQSVMIQPSEETKLKMVEFFLRTSVPRILAEREKQKKKELQVNGEQQINRVQKSI